jgi:hypothetical protein
LAKVALEIAPGEGSLDLDPYLAVASSTRLSLAYQESRQFGPLSIERVSGVAGCFLVNWDGSTRSAFHIRTNEVLATKSVVPAVRWFASLPLVAFCAFAE